MQNDNSIRRVFLSRNIQPSHENQNKRIDKKKEKEKLSRSQRTFNKNNHVHYYSKSSNQTNININKEKEISKKLSFNEIDDDEELDHPKPLISDDEEDINDLKNFFTKKIEKKLEIEKFGENQDLNLKCIPKSSEFQKVLELPPENIMIKEKKIDNYNYRPFQKSFKSETISRKQINHIKTQINNKINYIINNDDIINHNNTDKKIIPIKRVKQEMNNNKKKKYENSSSNQLKRNSFKNISIEPDNNFSQLMNENYNYLNIPNNKNINNSNNRTQINKKREIINNQKQQMNSVYIPKCKINYNPKRKKEEECEKNYSKDNNSQTEPNINNNSKEVQIIQQPQNDSKIKNLIKSKSINISNINNLFPNEQGNILQLEREKDKDNKIYEINKVDISEIPKIQNESININNNNVNLNNSNNNILNLQKIKSSEIKSVVEFQKNIFQNKLDVQNNSKYRKKTFERGGKFNNVQTTYVVISKKKTMKNIPKSNLSNITPEIIDYNKYKFINPTPSANCLNYGKLYKAGNIPQRYSMDLKFQNVNVNEKKLFGINKSQNSLPVKKYYNYNNLILNNFNDYDTNYKNYVESSINSYNSDKERNTCYLINKSNNSNNNIYDYDYNYEFYNYYNTNPIHNNNNSYISFNNNYNY